LLLQFPHVQTERLNFPLIRKLPLLQFDGVLFCHLFKGMIFLFQRVNSLPEQLILVLVFFELLSYDKLLLLKLINEQVLAMTVQA
jgi:hypothetical protein